MLRDLVVIDPERCDSEETSYRALVLFHEFGAAEGGSSTNEKLNKMGIIQGIWSLTQSFGDSGGEDEKVIELDSEQILVIRVEGRYFVALTVSGDQGGSGAAIPSQFYMGYLWLCYRFFLLHYGLLAGFGDAARLTDALNEHMIPFWNDIYLKPETLVRQGIDTLWPLALKRSELVDCLDDSGSASSDDDMSWDAIINTKLLLQEESFIGLKDVLVYHIPSDSGQVDSTPSPKDSAHFHQGFKNFGLVQNFCHSCDSLADVSNWIYHLFKQYNGLSSHVLAGNAHFAELPSTEHRGNQTDPSRLHDDDTAAEVPTTFGTKLLHNITLPISFAYDAVHEVGVTTGVSSSMSYLKSYIPSWSMGAGPRNQPSPVSTADTRYGYLISPLSPESLPLQYKMLKLNLTYNKTTKPHNLIFWYYQDMLVVLVADESFDKIWDKEYLKDISFILSLSMSKLYKSLCAAQEQLSENFAYFTVNGGTPVPEIRSSIPPCVSLPGIPTSDNPLQIAIDGLDQLLSRATLNLNNNADNILGLDIMGSLFPSADGNPSVTKDTKALPSNNNFLDSMETGKLWELYKELLIFLDSLQKSEAEQDIIEERLLTLNNGVLCYLKRDGAKFIIVLKNWYDKRYNDYPTKETTLFNNLGIDVINWWAKNPMNSEAF